MAQAVPVGAEAAPVAAPAALWARGLAFLVDLILTEVLGIAGGLLLQPLGIAWVAIGLGPLYYFLFWSHRSPLGPGRTFGNWLFRIRVVGADGVDVNFGQAMLRFVAFVLSIDVLLLGILWILVDRDRRGWHDWIAGTRVVKT